MMLINQSDFPSTRWTGIPRFRFCVRPYSKLGPEFQVTNGHVNLATDAVPSKFLPNCDASISPDSMMLTAESAECSFSEYEIQQQLSEENVYLTMCATIKTLEDKLRNSEREKST
jgi:hypothetical protein